MNKVIIEFFNSRLGISVDNETEFSIINNSFVVTNGNKQEILSFSKCKTSTNCLVSALLNLRDFNAFSIDSMNCDTYVLDEEGIEFSLVTFTENNSFKSFIVFISYDAVVEVSHKSLFNKLKESMKEYYLKELTDYSELTTSEKMYLTEADFNELKS